MIGAGPGKIAAHVSKETQLAMTWNMLGTIFAGALAQGVRPGCRKQAPRAGRSEERGAFVAGARLWRKIT